MKKFLLAVALTITSMNFSMGAIRLNLDYQKNSIFDKNGNTRENKITPVHTVLVGSEIEYLAPVYDDYQYDFTVLVGGGIDFKLGGSTISSQKKVGFVDKENGGKDINSISESLIETNFTPYATAQVAHNLDNGIILRGGLKVGAGLETHTYIKRTSYKDSPANNEGEITASFTMPMKLLFGVDYNHLTTNFEIGGKYLSKNKNSKFTNKNKFVFVTGLAIGYKF